MSKNNFYNEKCRIMFIKMTAKSKLNSVNFQLSKNGAIRQITLYSFSSSALNFQTYSDVLFNLLRTCTCTIHDT